MEALLRRLADLERRVQLNETMLYEFQIRVGRHLTEQDAVIHRIVVSNTRTREHLDHMDQRIANARRTK